MSSLRPQDRKSLCRFTFADGRQCRTPRSPGHPHLCSDHARKDSQARAADKLASDLSYFFSGEYLSACDLSAALGRLLPAVVRGDVKPKTARTVAYLAQTLMQAIHISQHEYTYAFGDDGWRKSIRNSVRQNFDYRHPNPPPGPPQSPQPQPVEPPLNCHSERSEDSAFSESQAYPSQTTPAPQPAPSPHTPLPPLSTEFVQHLVAGLQTGDFHASSEHRVHSASSGRSEPVPIGNPDSVGSAEVFRSASPPGATSSSPSAATAATGMASPAHSTPSSPIGHTERTEGSHPIPATPFARSNAPSAQPSKPPGTASSTPRLPRPGTPTLSTSTTTAVSSSTANPFRINTYRNARKC